MVIYMFFQLVKEPYTEYSQNRAINMNCMIPWKMTLWIVVRDDYSSCGQELTQYGLSPLDWDHELRHRQIK
jgi:hypothetical protein